ncbi:MAG TPA: Gfo/Idh/MocA family oxidoreductase [Verrucomicrobiae bacterium]|jgi:predicted dehydrogenase|nr:Gfo/Idh/MocA family oxidoreductase [Verrucomicrobiae bacterium]
MVAEERKIRWGVLGYARIARECVIPAICASANSLFHAIASRDDAKLADCRARFPTPKTYRGYGELIRDPEIDAVYIPLPNSLHQEWTIRAADRGKHVLCEKPLALNVAQCREMIEVCAANKVLLMEAFMYRYTDRIAKALEVLRSGALGEIKFITSTFRFLLANPESIKLKPELGGGALYDVGCYPINFTGMVLDEITHSQAAALPESISVQSVSQHGVDMIFSALLKYPSGILASLNCGFNAQKRVYSEIVGADAALRIPDTFFGNAGALTLVKGEDRRDIPVAETDRYRSEVEDFAGAILHRRAPRLSLAETVRNMEVLERLLAAAR